MPRVARQTPGGYVYHVLNRGVGRMRLFEDDGDYLAFEKVLLEGLVKYPGVRLCGFCVMPNHWHLVVWPRPGEDRVLSAWMRWVGTTHVRRWHQHRHSLGAGHVYQGRYKSFPVASDGHFLTVCRYVERNASRAGLSETAEAWRWGSLGLRERKASTLDEVEAELRSLLIKPRDWPVPAPRGWKRRVNRPESEAELEKVRRSVAKGTPLGDERWVARTAGKLGLGATLRGIGRPRKEC